MAEKNSITIGLVQTRVSEDISKNMEQTILRIKEAASKDAKIVCLQELYRTTYFPVDEKKDFTSLAESISGQTVTTFSKLAKELNVVIIAPIFEVDSSGKHYNTAVIIDSDGTVLGTYRKMHIPHDPFFYEKSYFDQGDTGYQIFRAQNITFGVLICYDQWFPEAARTLALQGADLIFYPSAIGYLEGDTLSQDDWHYSWETIQRSHAIANGIHVASINRVGMEGKINFWGASFVCDAFGRLIKRASETDEEVLVAELDLSQNKRIQEGWGFMRNRLPETYGLVSSRILSDIPRSIGFSMPAEWEKHDSTWLAWPHDIATFPEITKVEKVYLHMISALSKNEHINLFVKDFIMRDEVKKLIDQEKIDLQKINFYIEDYADVWFRDYGPIFVLNKEKKQIAFVHWVFNAWGGKYKDLVRDTQIPHVISNRLQQNNFRPGIIMEGGAVETNGMGTLLTTEQCLLDPNRNPTLSKPEIEKYLMDYFGARHVIWLKGGVEGDDTDGHIDNLARFVNPRTVLCAYEEDERDENHDILKQNYDILLQSSDQDGNKLQVIKVPMPPSITTDVRGKKTRLPASYLNFYIANNIVLVPTYGDKNDQIAQKIIQNEFPDRKVIGMDCRDLIYGMGAIHCIVQQQPALN